MSVLKRKRGLLAVGLAVSAFLATFYVAYAGFVQWSREQPASLTTIAVVPLPTSTMSLFQDAALTDPLTENEVLQFVVVKFEPPLAGIARSDTRVTLFLRNDSPDTALSVLSICCPGIFDTDTGEYVAAYQVFGESKDPIPPGGSQAIFIHVFDVQQGVAEAQFTVVIGAVGETTNDGAAVSTISPQLQAVLDTAAQEEPKQ